MRFLVIDGTWSNWFKESNLEVKGEEKVELPTWWIDRLAPFPTWIWSWPR